MSDTPSSAIWEVTSLQAKHVAQLLSRAAAWALLGLSSLGNDVACQCTTMPVPL
jgi:hypothetical protein